MLGHPVALKDLILRLSAPRLVVALSSGLAVQLQSDVCELPVVVRARVARVSQGGQEQADGYWDQIKLPERCCRGRSG